MPRASGPSPDRLARILADQARMHGLDPLIVLALIEVESTFQPRAVSPAGALGLMQVMPATGEEVAREMGLAWSNEKNVLFDPEENVRIGIWYLGKMQRRFGEIEQALRAFNAGPSGVPSERARGSAARTEGGFAERVLETWRGLRERQAVEETPEGI